MSPGNGNSDVRPSPNIQVEPGQIQEASLPASVVKPQPEVTMTSSIKPHSSTVCLDPLLFGNVRLEPLNTCTLRLDPHNSSVLRPDPTRLPSLQPSSLSSRSCLNSTTQSVKPSYLHHSPVKSTEANPEPQNNQEMLSYAKPFTCASACDATVGQVSRSSVSSLDTSPKVNDASDHENGNQVVVALPDPPPNSCLKSGAPTNHKDPRSSSRVGLRVHFKLPEDEEEAQSDTSCQSEDAAQASAKEPPPVRTKPKL